MKKIVNKMFRKAAQGEGPSGELSRDAFERQLLLTGKLASLEVRRLDRIRSLADVEFRVTSQWGEDGIRVNALLPGRISTARLSLALSVILRPGYVRKSSTTPVTTQNIIHRRILSAIWYMPTWL